MKGKKQPESLYIPQLESDACGIGLIANLEKKYSFQIVSDALTMLRIWSIVGHVDATPKVEMVPAF